MMRITTLTLKVKGELLLLLTCVIPSPLHSTSQSSFSVPRAPSKYSFGITLSIAFGSCTCRYSYSLSLYLPACQNRLAGTVIILRDGEKKRNRLLVLNKSCMYDKKKTNKGNAHHKKNRKIKYKAKTLTARYNVYSPQTQPAFVFLHPRAVAACDCAD